MIGDPLWHYTGTMELAPQGQRGRPSVSTKERADRLLQAVRGGNYLETAARYAGISYATLRRWILKADDPSAPEEYREFKEALEKARADAEVAALAKIQKAASDGAWPAAAWYLERSWPDRWGKRETNRIELVGEGGGPVQIVAGMINASGMNALAQRLRARKAEEDQDASDAETLSEIESNLIEEAVLVDDGEDYFDE